MARDSDVVDTSESRKRRPVVARPPTRQLDGIMSTIAEFYSRNLANEVAKGMRQKARSGGTAGKAPLGYFEVRRRENGRDVRTVDVNPERASLMQWAFRTYATGDWTTRKLHAELTERGLMTPRTARTPEKPVALSHL